MAIERKKVPDAKALAKVKMSSGFFGPRKHLMWKGMASLLSGNDGIRPAAMHWWYDGETTTHTGFTFPDPKPWLPLNVANEDFSGYWRLRPVFTSTALVILADGTLEHWISGTWEVSPPETIPGVHTAVAMFGSWGGLAIARGEHRRLEGWGGGGHGDQGPAFANVTAVARVNGAFAAMNASGAVVTWGNSNDPTPQPPIKDAVVLAGMQNETFGAITKDGSVLRWGGAQEPRLRPADFKERGLDGEWSNQGQSSSGAHAVAEGDAFALAGSGAWAVLQNNGRLTGNFGESMQDWHDIEAMTAGAGVLAAVDRKGKVRSDGYPFYGGDGGNHFSNAASLASTLYANAVLHRDGTVSAWGPPPDGPIGSDPAATVTEGLTDVIALAATFMSFAALSNNGRLVVWGNSEFVQDNVAAVYSYCIGFVVVFRDGRVGVIGDSGWDVPSLERTDSWRGSLPYLE